MERTQHNYLESGGHQFRAAGRKRYNFLKNEVPRVDTRHSQQPNCSTGFFADSWYISSGWQHKGQTPKAGQRLNGLQGNWRLPCEIDKARGSAPIVGGPAHLLHQRDSSQFHPSANSTVFKRAMVDLFKIMILMAHLHYLHDLFIVLVW